MTSREVNYEKVLFFLIVCAAVIFASCNLATGGDTAPDNNTTNNIIGTGYAYIEGNDLMYSADGQSFAKIGETDGYKNYCLDYDGNVYFTTGYNKLQKYSVKTKQTETIKEAGNGFLSVFYDLENSTLYAIFWADSKYYLLKKNNNGQQEYEFNPDFDTYKFVVSNGYIYYQGSSLGSIEKAVLTISDSDNKVTVSSKVDIAFPAGLGSAKINDMIVLDGNIYLAIGIGRATPNTSNLSSNETNGCVLKYNIAENSFTPIGLNTAEYTTSGWNAYYMYDTSSPGIDDCCLFTNPSAYKKQLYKNEACTETKRENISVTSKSPEFDDHTLFGYVQHFVAIKPKKLVVTQDRCFLYSDTDGIKYDKGSAVTSVDLETFALSDYTPLSPASRGNDFSDSSYIKLAVEDLYYNDGGTVKKLNASQNQGFILYN